jgi:hypothetical protein
MTNVIRPGVEASLLASGEAQTGRRKPEELRGSVRKRSQVGTGWLTTE